MLSRFLSQSVASRLEQAHVVTRCIERFFLALRVAFAVVIMIEEMGVPVQAQEISEIKLTASAYPVAPGAPVNLHAHISGAIQGTLEYRFSFGDGASSLDWSTSSSVTHVYSQIGHYDASVHVRDSTGLLGIQRLRISVLIPPARPFPQKSSSLLEDGKGRSWWTVNPDNDSVSRIARSGKVFEVPLGAGCHPQSLARSQQGDLWIPCFKKDELKVVSESGKIVQTIKLPYGAAPFGIVADPRRPRIYVSLYGRGALLALNTRQMELRGELTLGPTPRALALTADGSRILVTRFISPDEGGQVWDVDVSSFTPVLKRVIALPADLTTPDTQSSGRGIPNYVSSIAIDPSGSYALVAANKANIFRGLFQDGNDLNTVNTIRVMVAKINLTTGSEITSARRDIDNSESPSAVAFSPFGDYAFITLQGNNVIAVYDMFTPESADINFHATLARIETGLAPQGITFSRSGDTVAVQNFMDRTISLFAVTEFLLGTSSSFERRDYRSTTFEALQPDVLRGKQVFYNASDSGGREGRNRMSAEGYFSCATCHLDGSFDGRTWDFTGRGEGMRNTMDLRGRAGTSHGRVHWSANFDEIQDFENDMRNAFGGDGFLSENDFVLTADTLGVPKAGRSTELDALSVYVSSLDSSHYPRSPHKTAEGAFTEDARMGASIFVQQGCQICHAGPHFTDSTVGNSVIHNVGTLSTASGNRLGQTLLGIDTPTLLGLWDTAPYLHDGSAMTLDQVFQPGKGTIYQAEDGDLSGGAVFSSDQSLNGEAHGVLSVLLPRSPAAISFSAVPGGTGGSGRIGVRYHADSTGAGITIRVNGVPYDLPSLDTHHSGSHTAKTWNQSFITAELVAGDVNIVEVTGSTTDTSVTIDEVSVATPEVVEAALPHTRVSQISLPDQARLRSYLLQLDGRSDPVRMCSMITLHGTVRRQTVSLQIKVNGEKQETYRYTVWSGDRVIRRFRSRQGAITLNLRKVGRRRTRKTPSFFRVRAQSSQGEVSEQIFQYR
jgi:PKD repeat protein